MSMESEETWRFIVRLGQFALPRAERLLVSTSRTLMRGMVGAKEYAARRAVRGRHRSLDFIQVPDGIFDEREDVRAFKRLCREYGVSVRFMTDSAGMLSIVYDSRDANALNSVLRSAVRSGIVTEREMGAPVVEELPGARRNAQGIPAGTGGDGRTVPIEVAWGDLSSTLREHHLANRGAESWSAPFTGADGEAYVARVFDDGLWEVGLEGGGIAMRDGAYLHGREAGGFGAALLAVTRRSLDLSNPAAQQVKADPARRTLEWVADASRPGAHSARVGLPDGRPCTAWAYEDGSWEVEVEGVPVRTAGPASPATGPEAALDAAMAAAAGAVDGLRAEHGRDVGPDGEVAEGRRAPGWHRARDGSGTHFYRFSDADGRPHCAWVRADGSWEVHLPDGSVAVDLGERLEGKADDVASAMTAVENRASVMCDKKVHEHAETAARRAATMNMSTGRLNVLIELKNEELGRGRPGPARSREVQIDPHRIRGRRVSREV